MHETPGHITREVEFFSTTTHQPVPLESLHPDTVPTEAERRPTIAIIQDETRELQPYKKVGTSLEQMVDKLKTEETALERNIESHRSRASPIRRVPPEIWYHTFELVCLSERYALSISARARSDKWSKAPALALSQVSSCWRDLATKHPKLWSSISLDIFQLSKGGKRIVKLYLRNSGTRPLRLHLYDMGTGSPTDVLDVKAYLGQYGYSVLQMLFKLLPICTELTLELPNVMLSSIEPRSRNRVSLPLLRDFEWMVPSEDEIDDGALWFWVEFYNAPQLKEISIFNDSPVSLGILPYHQLTRVSIGWASLESVFVLLASCKNLSILVWSGLSGDVTSPSGSVPIVASNLQELSCSSIPLHDLDHFFASIIIPSVTSIDISPSESDDGSRRWREETLAAMLERSGAPLQNLKLDLEDWYLSLHGLEAILNTCSGLKSLELQIRRDEQATPNSFVAEFLSRLSVSDDQACSIIPELTTLRFHEISMSDAVSSQAIQVIVQMIESRSKKPQYTAMDLNISFSSKKFSPYCPYSKRVLELEQDIISRLQAIEKNGTRCVISWIEPEPLPPPGRAMNASNANSDSDDNDSENESSDGDDSDSEDESDEDFSDEEDDTEDSDDEAAVL